PWVPTPMEPRTIRSLGLPSADQICEGRMKGVPAASPIPLMNRRREKLIFRIGSPVVEGIKLSGSQNPFQPFSQNWHRAQREMRGASGKKDDAIEALLW